MRLILLAFLGLALTTFSFSYGMDKAEIAEYYKAKDLLSKKNYKAYYQVKAKLTKTPLYTYLQYQEILSDPEHFKDQTIEDFLKVNQGSFWAAELRKDLANYYISKQSWSRFLQYYEGNLGVNGQCYAIQAKYATGEQEAALADFTKLWLSRVRLPKACNDFETIWQNKIMPSEREIRLKTYALATTGYVDQALKWINKTNNKTLQGFYGLWLKASQNPKKFMIDWVEEYHQINGFSSAIVSVMDNLSAKDVYYAASFWQDFKQKSLLDDKTINLINAEIAIDFARSHHKEALTWLKLVESEYASSLLWQWRLRTALYWQDYKLYLKWYDELSTDLKSADEWRYWQAKSLAALKQMDKAKPIFTELAKQLSYYGFLSADVLKLPYVLTNENAIVALDVIKNMKNNLTVQQVFDLYQIGEYGLSYSLWRWSMNSFTREELLAIAKLAHDDKIYQISVSAYGNSGAVNDLVGLYPLAFWSDVKKAAKDFEIQPDVIIAMMRQESAFRVHGISSASATGLMQLLPSTAEFLAKKYRLDYKDGDLYQPNKVIILGAANLNFMDKLFNGKLVLGMAAYNAGQGNVANWLPEHTMNADQWIEIMPFGETRQYVKNILRNLVVYNQVILGNKTFHLSQLMLPISKKDKS
ncbi:lytic transglycosylase domain-containing protein [Fastidiosibacter lacustris]|uniref:lytic transglycosylase domain-containing protein n=1 Tax=Fastidiosibacter lacustris TaxID=2056695 RepID=UPI000E342B30|nr:lytic transglycosylase domain-containing protein [Fastidiosibacter lacustris]